jgi:hypothetical protein
MQMQSIAMLLLAVLVPALISVASAEARTLDADELAGQEICHAWP